MKIPSDKTIHDAHYAPYPPVASPPHSEFVAPAPPSSRPAAKRSQSSSKSVNASADAGEETQYKVARAISSCTRCRSRKQKCDGKLPACSACERAKVECIGFDAISKTNISRK
jgi:hypothetical protein